MKSIRVDNFMYVALLALVMFLAVVGTIQAAEANLHIQFTTTNAGGSYGDRHVHVVWIKDSSGNFVYTSGSTTTDNKRALWANSRAYSLTEWYNSNPTANRTADIAAKTGATETAYKAYSFDWNWRNTDGTVVPNGNYQIHFLCTNSDNGTPNNKTSFSITKGTSAWSVGPVSQGGYNNISLAYTPASLGVSALAATNVTSSSATLNGSVDATDGVNPNVYIYWGPTNGGTTPTAWANTVNLGTLGVGAFSTNITNLNASTTYYYRCRVVTIAPAKDIWSSTASSFTTQVTTFAQIDISPTAIDFGQVPLNTSRDISMIVKNLGLSALSINSLKFIGMENDAYSLVSPPALPLTLNAIQPPVPANWTGVNIGDSDAGVPTPSGSYTINSGSITVKGAGRDIWDGQDSFYYLYQTSTSTNIEIIARVDSVQNTNSWAKAGLMIRYGTSTTPHARNAAILVTPGNGVTFQWRSGSEDTSPTSNSTTAGIVAPRWVKLVRSGTTFSGYYSADGVTWIQQGTSQTVSMSSTFRIGLAVTSHNNGTLCTAVFSNLGGFQGSTAEVIDQRTLTVRFSPKSVQDYPYAKLAIGSNDSGKIDYVDLQGAGGPDAALSTRQVGGIGGNARAMARYGDKVLMGQGSMLVLLDVSNPAAPSKIDQIRLDGVIEAITVWGDAAYAALGNKGFAVVNLKNFKPLPGAATIETGGFASDIDSDGTNLCIADGIAGTHVYSLSSPLNPVFVKTYATTGAAIALDISGGLLYVLDESKGVQVFQFSSSTALKSYVTEFGTRMVVDGTRIYAIDSFGNLSILDATGSIVLQGEKILQIGSANDIQVQNGYAYITGQTGIEVIDISNPASPTSAAVYTGTGKPQDILLNNTVAYVADASSGLDILDISISSAVSSLGDYSLAAASGGVSSPDSLENVYAVGNGQNLASYDLSSSAEPVSKEVYGILDQAEDVAIQGQYAFVAAGLSGLQVFDLSNPAATPGSYATAAYASAVSANGTVAMVSDGKTVYVLDVSSPMTPSLIGSWQADGHVFDVAAGSTYGYVANGGLGVTILSLADANSVDSYQTNGIAYGVAIDQDTLYAACGTAGLTILNVSNPADPTLVTNYDLPGVIVDVAKVGSRLCAADVLSGVSIINVSNPAMPTLYANAATNASAFHISSAGSRILVADKQGGLAVLGVTPWPKDLPGDLSGDYRVNLDDLTIMAGQWLYSESYLDAIAANLDYYDTLVNLKDLSVLASGWLSVDPLLNNIEGYWKFNETAGSAAPDLSGNSRNGVLTNGPVWTSSGKLNGALQFDGVNDYVEITGYKGVTGTSSRTCSAWIKTSGSSVNSVIMDWGTSVSGQKWLFGIFTTGKLVLYTWSPYIQTNMAVTDNQWHHVAAVLMNDGTPDVSEIKLYVDGQLQAVTVSSAQAINTVSAANVLIGAYDSAGAKGGYFNGLIDDVRIYSAALSQQQIIDIALQP
jgi:hypothetical protein